MGWVTDLLKEYPALNVARERLALAEARYANLEEQNETLKLENARLSAELQSLRRRIPNNEWVEARGALFKRKADGSFEPDAYCPDCKRALSEPLHHFPLMCTKCEYQPPFSKSELPAIIASLNSG